MKHTVKLGILLAALWLVLSGHYTPLLLSIGLLSVLLVLWINRRMFAADRQHYFFHFDLAFIRFLLRLAVKVVQSNIDVCARILGLKPVDCQFIRLDLPFSDDVSKVLYANAITLTPGSASVHMENGHLYVHTISREGADELTSGGMLKIMPVKPSESGATAEEAH